MYQSVENVALSTSPCVQPSMPHPPRLIDSTGQVSNYLHSHVLIFLFQLQVTLQWRTVFPVGALLWWL